MQLYGAIKTKSDSLDHWCSPKISKQTGHIIHVSLSTHTNPVPQWFPTSDLERNPPGDETSTNLEENSKNLCKSWWTSPMTRRSSRVGQENSARPWPCHQHILENRIFKFFSSSWYVKNTTEKFGQKLGWAGARQDMRWRRPQEEQRHNKARTRITRPGGEVSDSAGPGLPPIRMTRGQVLKEGDKWIWIVIKIN